MAEKTILHSGTFIGSDDKKYTVKFYQEPYNVYVDFDDNYRPFGCLSSTRNVTIWSTTGTAVIKDITYYDSSGNVSTDQWLSYKLVKTEDIPNSVYKKYTYAFTAPDYKVQFKYNKYGGPVRYANLTVGLEGVDTGTVSDLVEFRQVSYIGAECHCLGFDENGGTMTTKVTVDTYDTDITQYISLFKWSSSVSWATVTLTGTTTTEGESYYSTRITFTLSVKCDSWTGTTYRYGNVLLNNWGGWVSGWNALNQVYSGYDLTISPTSQVLDLTTEYTDGVTTDFSYTTAMDLTYMGVLYDTAKYSVTNYAWKYTATDGTVYNTAPYYNNPVKFSKKSSSQMMVEYDCYIDPINVIDIMTLFVGSVVEDADFYNDNCTTLEYYYYEDGRQNRTNDRLVAYPVLSNSTNDNIFATENVIEGLSFDCTGGEECIAFACMSDDAYITDPSVDWVYWEQAGSMKISGSSNYAYVYKIYCNDNTTGAARTTTLRIALEGGSKSYEFNISQDYHTYEVFVTTDTFDYDESTGKYVNNNPIVINAAGEDPNTDHLNGVSFSVAYDPYYTLNELHNSWITLTNTDTEVGVDGLHRTVKYYTVSAAAYESSRIGAIHFTLTENGTKVDTTAHPESSVFVKIQQG